MNMELDHLCQYGFSQAVTEKSTHAHTHTHMHMHTHTHMHMHMHMHMHTACKVPPLRMLTLGHAFLNH